MASKRAGKKVLIVDDDLQIRTLLKRYLERAGYEVVGESNDGEDAIGKSSRLQPDFVLLDNEMPVLSGEDAAGRIRAASNSARIVAVSGSLTSRPGWSDAFLSKTGLAMVGELLDLMD
jgi:CheY-like chemotaxis protein